MDPLPTRIGPYRIDREIGRGGMGIVYLAHEEEGGRVVALKILPKEHTGDPVRLKRFQREAEAVMDVRHANVVPIYGVGTDGGVRYIAMKYIEGTSLDMLLRGQTASTAPPRPAAPASTVLAAPPAGPVTGLDTGTLTATGAAPPPPAPSEPMSEAQWIYRAVRIVEKIARALSHLHENGIVHRDVKPGNILIDVSGNAWLADFGLVRDVTASTLSALDGILGTVQYIAPEQIVGARAKADHRSDIYSLGVTLYELVTLRRPFDGQNATSTLYAVARELPTPPRKINPRLSDDLERVIQKAMAKDPDARYQSGDAFADDLRRVRTFEPVRAERPTPLARFRATCAQHPWAVIVIVLLTVVFLGLLGYCVETEFRERRRLAETRAEADRAFEEGRLGDAASGYRLYIRLGGDAADVSTRLDACERIEKSAASDIGPR